MYMLLDFVPGGDLFSNLRAARRFSPATVKHYAGCIILALDYVHSRGVVYRDLKPENLLLDIKGRIKLTDFGLAKKVTDRYAPYPTRAMDGAPKKGGTDAATLHGDAAHGPCAARRTTWHQRSSSPRGTTREWIGGRWERSYTSSSPGAPSSALPPSWVFGSAGCAEARTSYALGSHQLPQGFTLLILCKRRTLASRTVGASAHELLHRKALAKRDVCGGLTTMR